MNNERLLEHLRDLEEAAEVVLSERQEIVDLDRKRCQNQEAIRSLTKDHKEEQYWLATGNSFFKLPTDKAKHLMHKDQVRLDSEINALRSNLKAKVNNLRDKEGQAELKGFNLKALDSDEIAAMKQVSGK